MQVHEMLYKTSNHYQITIASSWIRECYARFFPLKGTFPFFPSLFNFFFFFCSFLFSLSLLSVFYFGYSELVSRSQRLATIVRDFFCGVQEIQDWCARFVKPMQNTIPVYSSLSIYIHLIQQELVVYVGTK